MGKRFSFKGFPVQKHSGDVRQRHEANRKRMLVADRRTAKPVAKWTVSDVSRWLDKLQMGKYKSVFAENEIDGCILLEVGADDLDYMDVKVLAHRKIILRALDSSRNPPAQASVEPPDVPASASVQADTASVGEGRVIKVSARAAAKFATDEEKKQEGESFKQAVSDWRNGTAKSIADIEAEEHAAFRKAVDEWRNGKSSSTSSSAAASSTAAATNEVTAVGPDDASEAKLKLSGNFLFSSDVSPLQDADAEEHEAFKRAVQSWRNAPLAEQVSRVNYEDHIAPDHRQE